MTPPPSPQNELTPQERSDLRALAAQIEKGLSDSTPLGQAIQQRDAFHLAWDQAINDVLKNMQEIRDEISLIRQDVSRALNLDADERTSIIAALEKIAKEAVRKRRWWEF
jgi:hypothetical protein